jgi:SAM-dependent methyltransferase
VSFEADAAVYDRFVGRYAPQLSAAMVGAADVAAGERVLDVGCGPGGLTRALAELVGEELVAAVDPSKSFVDACRARVPGADVRDGVAEALPFDSATFDVVLSQLVVNFMRDGEAGVREMARVTRPGGVVASCVWDYGGEMTLLRTFWDAAREVAPERAGAADEGVVMRWCAEGELAELWRSAGLASVRFGSLVASAQYADFEDLWSPLPTGVGPAGAFCKSLGEDDRAALRDVFRRRLDVGDGPFQLTARAWAVAGSVPG